MAGEAISCSNFFCFLLSFFFILFCSQLLWLQTWNKFWIVPSSIFQTNNKLDADTTFLYSHDDINPLLNFKKQIFGKQIRKSWKVIVLETTDMFLQSDSGFFFLTQNIIPLCRSRSRNRLIMHVHNVCLLHTCFIFLELDYNMYVYHRNRHVSAHGKCCLYTKWLFIS